MHTTLIVIYSLAQRAHWHLAKSAVAMAKSCEKGGEREKSWKEGGNRTVAMAKRQEEETDRWLKIQRAQVESGAATKSVN